MSEHLELVIILRHVSDNRATVFIAYPDAVGSGGGGFHELEERSCCGFVTLPGDSVCVSVLCLG